MISLSILRLNSKRKSYYSQWGEDGVLEYILGKLPDIDRHLVEFGAWDGKHLSNGFHFIEKKNYTGVLIEMETDRFFDLQQNMAPYKTICIQAMVGFEGENRLDNLLNNVEIPKNFDLLSIDIDGNDYQVWEALQEFKPKVVIIEINAAIQPGIFEINNPNVPFELFVSGSSISALNKLGNSKGYRMILNVGCNAIFVDSKYYDLFHMKELDEYDLFTYEALKLSKLNFSQQIQTLVFRVFRPNLFGRALKFLRRLLNI